ncbi:hypothetical protein [Priestia filamentosa]|uniref:hypothetical protein n=1 Tax=Priestia filamentosa TaxID=1402861 RepID=UPI000E76CE30|nr:hypothetical protein [Priestia filamentosa]RJS64719.1 hypothetical protein CJ485_08140 [Priestia filamentosa]
MKKAFIFIILFLLIGIGFLFSVRESDVFAQFPIPRTAKKEAKISHDSSVEKYARYSWPKIKKDEPIPSSYKTLITMWGWKEKEQQDRKEMTVFKKDEKEIRFFTHDGFFILVTTK